MRTILLGGLSALCLAGCAALLVQQQGQATAVIDPVDQSGRNQLRCQNSSSGVCYFRFAKAGASGIQTVAVPQGTSASIELPAEPTPFCVSWNSCDVEPQKLVSRSGLQVFSSKQMARGGKPLS
jgi:hypothetical protein